MRGDYHVHTAVGSPCAKEEATVENYLSRCKEEGLCALGFSDHYWEQEVASNYWYEVCNFENLSKIYQTIPQDANGVKIFVGCETDIDKNGVVGISKETASKLDFVLIPNSHYHIPTNTPDGLDINDAKAMRAFAIERFLIGCNADLPVHTCMCHPFIPHGVKDGEGQLSVFTDNDYIECFKEAARKNVFVELHLGMVTRKYKKMEANGFAYEYLRMISLAKECGCKFQYGSDAHWLSMFEDHARMEEFARACGIDDSLILRELSK